MTLAAAAIVVLAVGAIWFRSRRPVDNCVSRAWLAAARRVKDDDA